MANEPHSVGDLLDGLEVLGRDRARVSIGDVVQAFGTRSYGPFLLVPALIEESPLGGIPGFSTATAVVIACFAAQMLLGRRHLWLPAFLKRRVVQGEKLTGATARLRGVARFLDRWFHRRLRALTGAAAVRVAAVIVLALCVIIPLCELIPWSGSVPMVAIAAFGLALLVRDGVLMVAATIVAGVGIALAAAIVLPRL